LVRFSILAGPPHLDSTPRRSLGSAPHGVFSSALRRKSA